MLDFLKLRNWSKLLNDDSDYSTYLKHKRNVLFSQFCIIGSFAAIIQAVYDTLDGYPLVASIDSLFLVILVAGYFLNEKGSHNSAKMLVLLSMNIMLFSFSAVVPKGVGMFLLFYPLVAFSFIVFDYRHRKYSYSLAILSIVLNATLVLTEYQPYGQINLQPSDPTISFALNLIISIVMISLGIDFLLTITHKAEEKLVESQQKAEKLALEINEKNQYLEKTNQELDRFVYSTSHDLRAPLASILGLINLTELVKEPIPEEVKKYLKLMKERVNSLDDFIQDIIDYSRNTRTELLITEVNIPELIEEVIQNNRFLENSQKVKIHTRIEVNKTINADKNRLFRILNNLVSNAIKYNDLGKENPFVEISAKIESGKLVIKVADSGLGIPDEVKDQVFNMFFRGTESAEGSGLGLYIAREMAQKLDGELTFVSEKGKGTTFTLSIPVEI